ncbi:MAG: polysaccharide deacetylase family protein [Candidatus Omnitrophica bacterium]|nr:polysaccharide deacetylase family protein [Candidatus Omnitrophota bacterium]
MKLLHSFLRKLESLSNINILMYHGFTDEKSFKGIENYHGKHLHIDKFKEQVRYLKKYYHIIKLEEFISCLVDPKPVPSSLVVITMDDGYRSNFTLAYPVLKEFAVPATIFLTTNFIDKKEYLWTDRIEFALNGTAEKYLEIVLDNNVYSYNLSDFRQKQLTDRDIKSKLRKLPVVPRDAVIEDIENKLKQKLQGPNPPAMYAPLERKDVMEMVRSNLVSVGSHTCSHVVLSACLQDMMKDQLLDSKKYIEELTEKACAIFSYPNGATGDFNELSKRILKDSGYKCALTTIIGTNNAYSDIFELKRLNLHNDGDLTGFICTLSSLGRFLRKIKNADLFGGQYQ